MQAIYIRVPQTSSHARQISVQRRYSAIPEKPSGIRRAPAWSGDRSPFPGIRASAVGHSTGRIRHFGHLSHRALLPHRSHPSRLLGRSRTGQRFGDVPTLSKKGWKWTPVAARTRFSHPPVATTTSVIDRPPSCLCTLERRRSQQKNDPIVLQVLALRQTHSPHTRPSHRSRPMCGRCAPPAPQPVARYAGLAARNRHSPAPDAGTQPSPGGSVTAAAERRPPSSATRYSKACSETLQNRKPALLVSHVPGGHCRGHPPAKSPADLNPHARLTTTPRKPVPRLPGITGNPGHRPRLVGATHDDRKAEFSDVATAAQAAPQDATAGGSHLLGPEQDRQAAGSMPAIDALSPPAFAQIGVERRRPVIRSRAIGLTQDLPARAIAVVRPPTVPLLDALHMLHRSSSTRSLDRRSPTTGRQRLGLPTHRL